MKYSIIAWFIGLLRALSYLVWVPQAADLRQHSSTGSYWERWSRKTEESGEVVEGKKGSKKGYVIKLVTVGYETLSHWVTVRVSTEHTFRVTPGSWGTYPPVLLSNSTLWLKTASRGINSLVPPVCRVCGPRNPQAEGHSAGSSRLSVWRWVPGDEEGLRDTFLWPPAEFFPCSVLFLLLQQTPGMRSKTSQSLVLFPSQVMAPREWRVFCWYPVGQCVAFPLCPLPPGLHHDPLPEALLEGWEAVLPEHQQPQHDVWRPAGEEDLGSWHVFCALQALLHPRYHHGQCYAAGPAWWESALQPQVRLLLALALCLFTCSVLSHLKHGNKGKSSVFTKKSIGSTIAILLFSFA